MWNLTNKRVLITGGTKGIGRAAVLEFLALGADALFTARHADEVRAVETELRTSGLTATGLRADVAVADDLEATATWIEEHWGALDVLVNNAGVNLRKATTEYTSDEYHQIIDVDLLAPFAWSRRLFSLLQKGQQPAIVNVASTPQKRVAQADEMAAAIAFLAMDKASYITGQNLIVNGGLTANAL